MAHRKPHLPTKICVSCNRPFAWRKKWAKDWQNVKYCSKQCRGRPSPRSHSAPNNGSTSFSSLLPPETSEL
ncbi:MAG: DUF2256 domain-containing protein [Gammaproteobacteria bacterium]|nr:DUF2256 domain-containing protein [Gammaproteobacteria bacterium]